MKYRICVITSARSEYGLLRWIIDDILKDSELELQLIVTGGHLSQEQGETYKFIEEDGYKIDVKIPILIDTNTEVGIAKSMGVCGLSLADIFDQLQPDILVVLGDRYELLPIVSTALVMRIPIAHISGGDVTEGAIDNEIRNAVTMMSDIHFPDTNEAALNIQRMLGKQDNIHVIGHTGLDNFKRCKLLNREELGMQLGLDLDSKWFLVTQHSETKLSIEQNIGIVEHLFNAIKEIDGAQFIITKANADFGGSQINNYWENIIKNENSDKYKLYSSLGQIRYLSIMRQVSLILGNSSSGIVEAPCLGVPVVNIGNRQKGRHMCSNIICSGTSYIEIKNAIELALKINTKPDYYWGDGNTSNKIVKKIKGYLKHRS